MCNETNENDIFDGLYTAQWVFLSVSCCRMSVQVNYLFPCHVAKTVTMYWHSIIRFVHLCNKWKRLGILLMMSNVLSLLCVLIKSLSALLYLQVSITECLGLLFRHRGASGYALVMWVYRSIFTVYNAFVLQRRIYCMGCITTNNKGWMTLQTLRFIISFILRQDNHHIAAVHLQLLLLQRYGLVAASHESLNDACHAQS